MDRFNKTENCLVVIIEDLIDDDSEESKFYEKHPMLQCEFIPAVYEVFPDSPVDQPLVGLIPLDTEDSTLFSVKEIRALCGFVPERQELGYPIDLCNGSCMLK